MDGENNLLFTETVMSDSAEISSAKSAVVSSVITEGQNSSLANTTPVGALATYHDNAVEMTNKTAYTIEEGKFILSTFSITSGQQDPKRSPYVGQPYSYSGNSGKMTFRAGRKGSSDVANWWIKEISSNQNTFNHDPEDLNFAFVGDLFITLSGGGKLAEPNKYTITGAAFAQGNSSQSNNWWFGCKNGRYDKDNTIKCTASSPTGFPVSFYFLRGGNGVSTIALTKVEFPDYTMFALQPGYAGENVAKTWQTIPGRCPPYVLYYDSSKAKSLKLVVRDNRLYSSLGERFDTSNADTRQGHERAIFVMDSDGTVYASNVHKRYLFAHSTFLAGAAVASAGTLIVDDGVIKEMSAMSGHYKPVAATAYDQLKEALYHQGYTKPFGHTTFQLHDPSY